MNPKSINLYPNLRKPPQPKHCKKQPPFAPGEVDQLVAAFQAKVKGQEG